MSRLACIGICLLAFSACNQKTEWVVSSDIDLFWKAYDQLVQTEDPILQRKILEESFLNVGSPGLEALGRARNYTVEEYLEAIRNYPEFWASIRPNTLKAHRLSEELETGVAKLKKIYPDLRPANIFFTIGVLRTGGTVMEGNVLIGSEVAMADAKTVSREFPESLQGLRGYFDTNPIHQIVLLNVHEYVHTQQKPMVHNLLSQVLYEGVAEFVSVKAMGVPSSSPAIAFGKANSAVRETFEREMFYMNNRHEWLWSSAENDFGVRDLGYYIGYQICENHYQAAADKVKAIKDLVELDYNHEAEVEALVDGSGFFSKPLAQLYSDFEAIRPTVIRLENLENHSQEVDHRLNVLQVRFSKPMMAGRRNFDFGPLGEDAVVRFKREIGFSADGKTYSFEIMDLLPGKHYQLLLGSGFVDENGVPLKPYLIEFHTSPE